jgi:hypothetical protein
MARFIAASKLPRLCWRKPTGPDIRGTANTFATARCLAWRLADVGIWPTSALRQQRTFVDQMLRNLHADIRPPRLVRCNTDGVDKAGG